MIALVITGLMGACIAVMINSVSAGTVGEQDGRRHLVRIQALQSRISTLLHSSQCILAAGPSYLVYWSQDTNNDHAVQLSELAMLQLNGTVLQQYTTVWPEGFSPVQIASANATYATNSNWYSAAQNAKTSYLKPRPIATNVAAFTVTWDALVTPRVATNANMATCIITLSDGQVQRTAAFTAALRAPAPPQ